MPENVLLSRPSDAAMIVVDAQTQSNLMPLQFRTTKDIYKPCFIKQLIKAGKEIPSRKGFEELKVSASAQFSQTSFENMLKILGPHVYIVDLRLESHGFAGGHAVSLYAPENGVNKGLSLREVQEREATFLKGLDAHPPQEIYQIMEKGEGQIRQTMPIQGPYMPVMSEAQLAQENGVLYVRFTTLDHSRPDDAVVDSFVTFVRDLEDEAWLHFHCRAGRGRTTQFLAMYDMLRNAPDVSFEGILLRHFLIGGSPLLSIDEDPGEKWKRGMTKDRLSFLEHFYQYAKDPKGYRDGISWQQWQQKAPQA